ncbi:conserved hypothetical protein [Mesorhizobium plurifarium]|uniref:Uncharacterized protein n=1 Tax=Mesorhizobium plurifarium TaxID=69974 RepID=A0A090EA05_MESPL|nr:conserved hypothetical protein [Mesorhizobium plurifarium]
MSEFHIFGSAVAAQFRRLADGELYAVQAEDLFEKYLAAFPEGSNPVFRVRTEHDCSCCKHFIRNVGHLVSLQGGEITTMWDVFDLPHPYDKVAARMSEYVRSLPIVSIFRTKEGRFGQPFSNELREGETSPIRWTHFHCDIVGRHRSNRPDADRGAVTTNVGVFRRGLEEITLDALNLVIDLINENNLYRGAEFRPAVQTFMTLHMEYPRAGTQAEKDVFVWSNVRNPAALFRNTVIGTLVVDLSDGMDEDAAVRSFEKKVAPENYKRPTALITPKMIEDAVAKLRDMGLESAIERRFAKLADVSVNNVLFVDNSVRGTMKDGIAGLLMEEVRAAPPIITNPTPISMEDFLTQIVPQASSINLLVQNKHLANFVSVTAPVHDDAGRLFKWDNGFAWSYDGDATDSIKQRVKRAGGNVDATLRVSLAWSNFDDLDLHVLEPDGNHVFFGNKSGKLDVDMNAGGRVSREPVENICWAGRLRDGEYRVWVNNYAKRETIDVGFTIELEYAGSIQQFSYAKALPGGQNAEVMLMTVRSGELIRAAVHPGLVGGSVPQEKWGIKTETLVPVDTLMASPNHWDGQEIGNKHWFFILKGCRNPEPARGIYNEFLKGALEPHRKVFEVLGAKTKCPVSEEQLSGVGYSSTRKDEAVVVVKGDRINKAFHINF